MSFAKEVWENLSAINVNDHTERKGNLTYLSWSWAWATLMSKYPESSFVFNDSETFPDGSLEVRCTVTVAEGDHALTRSCWLPVMDNRNNAIEHPDARKVSDSKMRCLVKNLAFFGLGHYIYAGDDLPQTDDHALDAFLSTIDGTQTLDELLALGQTIAAAPMSADKKGVLRAAFTARKAALSGKE